MPSQRSQILGTVFVATVCVAGCRDGTWKELGTLTAPAPAAASSMCSGLLLGDDGTGRIVAGASTGGPSGEVDTFSERQGGDGLSFDGALRARPEAVGWFGAAVSFWKGELAVGASHDDPYRIDNGYVDIYALKRAGSAATTWTYETTVVAASVTPPPVDTGSTEFGFAKSIDLNGDDLIVGAGRFGGGYGRAFLFHRAGGVFQQVSELTEGDQQRFDSNFGDSVRLDAGTAVVSRPDSPASTGPGAKAGKVYVYTRASGTWTLQQILQAPAADGSYDGFGTAVALAGDQLAVRANDTVWVFRRRPGTGSWTPVWNTSAGGGGRDSIALSSSYLAIGEPAAAVGDAASAGTVRLFANGGDEFMDVATRTEPAAGAGHGFGTHVALDDDRLLVGAVTFAEAGSDSGVATTVAYMEGVEDSAGGP